MAQTQTLPSAAFEHERCKPNAACAQKVIPVMNCVATDEDIGLIQVCDVFQSWVQRYSQKRCIETATLAQKTNPRSDAYSASQPVWHCRGVRQHHTGRLAIF